MSDGSRRPLVSVVIPAYNARRRIAVPLRSLQRQSFQNFEVVVVDSGPDSCAETAMRVDSRVMIVRSPQRLGRGAARNRGIGEARGDFIAFMPDDCEAVPGWLGDRVRCHRQGHALVSGSIVNGYPRHPIATAEYLLEYSALLPSRRVLEMQSIPHALSFSRSVLEQVGRYPEDTLTGEDTLFNLRCVREGVTVGFAPRAALAHYGSTRLRDLMSHAFYHGVGLAQCINTHELASELGQAKTRRARFSAGTRYIVQGWQNKLVRIWRGAPRLLPAFLTLSPLILLASAATVAGAWAENERHASSARLTPEGPAAEPP